MQTVDITPADAASIMLAEQAEGRTVTVTELEALGFNVVVGDVQVADKATSPAVESSDEEELLAAVQTLLEKAHAPRKGSGFTNDGRAIRTLNPYDGIAPYTVVVYAPKS